MATIAIEKKNIYYIYIEIYFQDVYTTYNYY